MDNITGAASDAFKFAEQQFNKLPEGMQKAMKAPFDSFVDQTKLIYRSTQGQRTSEATQDMKFKSLEIGPRTEKKEGKSHEYRDTSLPGNVEVGEKTYKAANHATRFIGKTLNLKLNPDEDSKFKTGCKVAGIVLLTGLTVPITGTVETIARALHTTFGDDAQLLKEKIDKREYKSTKPPYDIKKNPDKFLMHHAIRLPKAIMPEKGAWKKAEGAEHVKVGARIGGAVLTSAAIVFGAGLVRTTGKLGNEALKGAQFIKAKLQEKEPGTAIQVTQEAAVSLVKAKHSGNQVVTSYASNKAGVMTHHAKDMLNEVNKMNAEELNKAAAQKPDPSSPKGMVRITLAQGRLDLIQKAKASTGFEAAKIDKETARERLAGEGFDGNDEELTSLVDQINQLEESQLPTYVDGRNGPHLQALAVARRDLAGMTPKTPQDSRPPLTQEQAVEIYTNKEDEIKQKEGSLFARETGPSLESIRAQINAKTTDELGELAKQEFSGNASACAAIVLAQARLQLESK